MIWTVNKIKNWLLTLPVKRDIIASSYDERPFYRGQLYSLNGNFIQERSLCKVKKSEKSHLRRYWQR